MRTRVSRRVRPARAASGRSVAASSTPCSGCTQRSFASRSTAVPLVRSTIGSYEATIRPLSSAPISSGSSRGPKSTADVLREVVHLDLGLGRLGPASASTAQRSSPRLSVACTGPAAMPADSSMSTWPPGSRTGSPIAVSRSRIHCSAVQGVRRTAAAPRSRRPSRAETVRSSSRSRSRVPRAASRPSPYSYPSVSLISGRWRMLTMLSSSGRPWLLSATSAGSRSSSTRRLPTVVRSSVRASVRLRRSASVCS